MGVKASHSMELKQRKFIDCLLYGLKSAQAWGCLFKYIRSALTPFHLPSAYLSLHKKKLKKTCFRKLADRYKCAQPIGEIFSTPPLPFVVGVDSWLRSWLRDKVSYSQLRHRVGSHTPCFSLSKAFEYNQCLSGPISCITRQYSWMPGHFVCHP